MPISILLVSLLMKIVLFLLFFLFLTRPLVADEAIKYFPEDTLREFTVSWYSKHLRAMREPSLSSGYGGGRGAEVYRFLHLPTWGRPFAVRIEKVVSNVSMRAVRLSGSGGYEPGVIAEELTRTKQPNYWKRVVERLDEIDFWRLPTEEKGVRGMDGRETIIEGWKDGKYHVVVRWSPEHDTKGRALENYLNFFETVLNDGGIAQNSPNKKQEQKANN